MRGELQFALNPSSTHINAHKANRVGKMSKLKAPSLLTKIQAPRVVMDCLLKNCGELIRSVRAEAGPTLVKCDATTRQIIFEGPRRQKAMMIMYGKLDRRNIRFTE